MGVARLGLELARVCIIIVVIVVSSIIMLIDIEISKNALFQMLLCWLLGKVVQYSWLEAWLMTTDSWNR